MQQKCCEDSGGEQCHIKVISHKRWIFNWGKCVATNFQSLVSAHFHTIIQEGALLNSFINPTTKQNTSYHWRQILTSGTSISPASIFSMMACGLLFSTVQPTDWAVPVDETHRHTWTLLACTLGWTTHEPYNVVIFVWMYWTIHV